MRMTRTITIAFLAVSLMTGTAIVVAAQDEGSEPQITSFTGSFTTQSDVILEGTKSEADGLEETTGHVRQGSMVSSDPRLTGTFTATVNWLVDTTEMLPDFSNFNVLSADTFELTNDGGSWLAEMTSFGNIEQGVNKSWIVFVGQGGYEGLTAVAAGDWLTPGGASFVGTVFPRPMPEIPEPYVADQA